MNRSITTLFLVLALPLSALAQTGMNEQPAAPVATEAAAPAGEPAPVTRPVEEPRPFPVGERPKDLDLRHCLDLGDNLAIARCAHE